MALAIPSLILKRLHTYGSLTNTDEGVQFSLKNRLSDAELTGIGKLKIDGKEIPFESVTLLLDDGDRLSPYDLVRVPLDFPLRKRVDILCDIEPLALGKHKIEIHFDSRPFGKLKLKAEDAISEEAPDRTKIPRSSSDDYSEEIIKERRKFVEQFSGVKLEHVVKYSLQ